MAAQNFDYLFDQYYTLYRAEAQIPDSADDEYTIALALSKEAISYWENYDNTFWKELFTTAQTSPGTGGVSTITTGVSDYACNTDMKIPGGSVVLKDPVTGNTMVRYPILEPQDVQFRTDYTKYAYFTGDPHNGFVLHLNTAPTSTQNGYLIDYVYYKKATEFTTGTSVTEMSNPFFIVHRMLANRFRASRNPYTTSAKQDAENAMRVMQMTNNSGNWADPWKLADNSGTQWGL